MSPIRKHMRKQFDFPGMYAVQVAGEVNERWSERLGGMTLMLTESEGDDSSPVTVLMGVLPDQAALAGVLDTLYQNRYPLLYVKYLGPVTEEQTTG